MALNKGNIMQKIINDFLAAQKIYNEAEEKMSEHFEKQMQSFLDQGDSNKAKESLRSMPESAARILLFRQIVLWEDKHK